MTEYEPGKFVSVPNDIYLSLLEICLYAGIPDFSGAVEVKPSGYSFIHNFDAFTTITQEAASEQ